MTYTAMIASLAILWVAPRVADADCAIELKFNNTTAQQVTVSADKSKVSIKTSTGISEWKKFMSTPVVVNAGQDKTYEANIELPCDAGMRKFKFYFETADGSSHWEKQDWIDIPVDRKVNVTLK